HRGVRATQRAADLTQGGGGLVLTGNQRKQLRSLGVVGGRKRLLRVRPLTAEAAEAADLVRGGGALVPPVPMESVGCGPRLRRVLGTLRPRAVGGHEIPGRNLLDGSTRHVHAGA